MVETARRESRTRMLFLMLVAVGLVAAGYLAFLHLKVHTDPAYQSFCSVSATVNCTSVAESRWAVFLGLPVATWGLVGYGLMGALALAGMVRRKPHPAFSTGLVYLLAAVALAGAVMLAVISKAVIHSWCLVCMVSWATTLGLYLIARHDLRRTGMTAVTAIRKDLRAVTGNTALSGLFVGAPIALVGALLILYPHYWEAPVRQGPGGLATGLAADGSPWIGSTDPKVTLEVFADYECPHCAKENFGIRETLEQNPGLRLVFRNYPLDASCNPIISGPFHLQACRLALATTCAREQGKFWELSDAIFQVTGKGDADLPALVAQAGVDPKKLRECMASDRAKQKLKSDVMDGMRYDIRGTPAFIYEGRMYEGGIPPPVLQRVLEAAR